MSKWQRYSLGIAAFIAWLVLLGVSLVANWKFAHSLGHSPLEKHVLSGGSIASDLFKAAAPVAFLWLASKKNWNAAIAVAVVGITATIFSLVAASGFVAGERFRAYHTAHDAVERTNQLRTEIEKATQSRDWIPTHKPLPVLEAEKRAMELDARYRLSGGCTRAGGATEVWCRELRQLDVAIAAAIAAEKADEKIAEKRDMIARDGRSYGDAQIEFISMISGMNEKTVLISLVILGVLLIELGSALGLTVALGLLAPEGSKIGKVLSIVRPQPKVPQPDQLKMVVGGAPAPGPISTTPPRPTEPTPVKPDGGGLRAKLKPVERIIATPSPVRAA